jgi:hypothetical protein
VVQLAMTLPLLISERRRIAGQGNFGPFVCRFAIHDASSLMLLGRTRSYGLSLGRKLLIYEISKLVPHPPENFEALLLRTFSLRRVPHGPV